MEWDGRIKASKARGKIEVEIFGDKSTNFTKASLDDIVFSTTAGSLDGAQFRKKKGKFKADLEDINGDSFIDIEGTIKVKDLVKLGGVSPDSDSVFANFSQDGATVMTFEDQSVKIV